MTHKAHLDRTGVTNAGIKLQPRRAFSIALGCALMLAVIFCQKLQHAGAQQPSAAAERRLRGHTAPVHCVRFTPDGKRLLSASGWPGTDYSIRAWDLDTDRELYRVSVPGTIGSLELSADGRFALVGSTGTIYYIVVESGQILEAFRGHNQPVRAVAFAGDGKHVYTASNDGSARQWQLAGGKEVQQFRVEERWARGVVELAGGRIVTADSKGLIQVWDVASGQALKQIDTGPVWVSSMTVAADRRHILLGTAKKGVMLWDLETGQRLRTFEGHDDEIQEISFSPDGQQLLTASFDGTVRLWDFASGQPARTLCTQDELFWTARFSPDGKLIAVAGGGRREGKDFVPGRDHDIRLLDPHSSQAVATNTPAAPWRLRRLAIALALVLSLLVGLVACLSRRRRVASRETSATLRAPDPRSIPSSERSSPAGPDPRG
jgi:WD40 repeat protein